MNRRVGTFLPGIISSLAWAVIVSSMYSGDWFADSRLYLLDRLFVARENLDRSPLPHPDVFIVGVDEQTVEYMREELGEGADNRHVIRTTLVRLLEKLDRARAGTVAIDFLLDHPLKKIDEEIVKILSRENNCLNVVFGCHRTIHEQKFPVEALQQWAAIGNVLLVADSDGRYRRFGYMEDHGNEADRLKTTLEERVILPFAVQACRVHTGEADQYGSRLDSPFRIVTAGGAFVSVELGGDISVPMEPLIDFTGPARTFQRRGQKLSALDVIGPDSDDGNLSELLGGKLIMIGPDFRHADRFAVSIPVPEDDDSYDRIAEKYRKEIDNSRLRGRDVQLDFSDAMGGVEIHANIASQIL